MTAVSKRVFTPWGRYSAVWVTHDDGRVARVIFHYRRRAR